MLGKSCYAEEYIDPFYKLYMILLKNGNIHSMDIVLLIIMLIYFPKVRTKMSQMATLLPLIIKINESFRQRIKFIKTFAMR